VLEERGSMRVELRCGPPGAASGPRVVLRSRLGTASYPAVRVRSMRVRATEQGAALVLLLFSRERAVIPLSSRDSAEELMRRFAAAINQQLESELAGPLARGIEEAFRNAQETEQGRNE
jgi:hypothetical protein